MTAINYKRSLERLKRGGCPAVADNSGKPEDSIIILDHLCFSGEHGLFAESIKSLSGISAGNFVVVPEVVFDFFDQDHKASRQRMYDEQDEMDQEAGDTFTQSDSPRPVTYSKLNFSILQSYRDLLQQSEQRYNLVMQHVRQYDMDYIAAQKLNCSKNDPPEERLYIACALYFKKRCPDRHIVLLTDSAKLRAEASKLGIFCCSHTSVLKCGDDLKKFVSK